MDTKTVTTLVATFLIATLSPLGAADDGERLATSSKPSVDTFLVPAGHFVVGRALGGDFVREILPLDAAVILQDGPTTDCENDVNGWNIPLTGNLLYPAVPNRASAGECTGYNWGPFDGPVNYVTFRYASTDGYWAATLDLASEDSDLYDYWQISCHPLDSPTVMAGAAAGAGSIFKNTVEVQNSECTVTQQGRQPSAWSSYLASTSVSGEGTAYGSVTTAKAPVGDRP